MHKHISPLPLCHGCMTALASPGVSVTLISPQKPVYFLVMRLQRKKQCEIMSESEDHTRTATVRGLLMSSRVT